MSTNKGGTGGFQRLDQKLTNITKYISYISAVFLIGIMLLAFVDVCSAKLLNRSISNSKQIIEQCTIPMIFFSVAFVQMTRGHTNITLVLGRLPKPLKTAVNILGDILGAGVSFFVSWRAIVLAQQYFTMKKSSTSGTGGFDLWPFPAIFAFGYALLGLAFLFCILKEFVYYHRPPVPAEQEAQPEPREKGEN